MKEFPLPAQVNYRGFWGLLPEAQGEDYEEFTNKMKEEEDEGQ
jgi:hypothetical protein